MAGNEMDIPLGDLLSIVNTDEKTFEFDECEMSS